MQHQISTSSTPPAWTGPCAFFSFGIRRFRIKREYSLYCLSHCIHHIYDRRRIHRMPRFMNHINTIPAVRRHLQTASAKCCMCVCVCVHAQLDNTPYESGDGNCINRATLLFSHNASHSVWDTTYTSTLRVEVSVWYVLVYTCTV